MDLYANTNNKAYLSTAFEIAYDNVNELVSEQRTQNRTYLADVVKQSTKDLDKETKKQVESYNKLLTETRKTELSPVYEPLRLNCELLFGLADKLQISSTKQKDIDSILHPNGKSLFLNPLLDNQYWFSGKMSIATTDIDVSYDKGVFEIPAEYITDTSEISVTITLGSSKTVIDNWKLTEVKRGKSHDSSDFVAVFESATAKKADYPNNATIAITVSNGMDGGNSIQTLNFAYKAVVKSFAWVIHPLSFERTR